MGPSVDTVLAMNKHNYPHLDRITPEKLEAYLVRHGWLPTTNWVDENGPYLVLYEKPGLEFQVPLRQTFSDYGRRVAELIRDLAEYESRSVLSVIADLTLGHRPDVNAIEARANRATPGPWVRSDESSDVHGPDTGFSNGTHICRIETDGQFGDTAFIASARNDVPALIAYVRELESLLGIGGA